MIEGVLDDRGEVRKLELDRRDVDGNVDVIGPLHRCCACLTEHPFADRDDRADVLGDGYEDIGFDRIALRVRPAKQRFIADDPAAGGGASGWNIKLSCARVLHA